jgi:hypothetical protein
LVVCVKLGVENFLGSILCVDHHHAPHQPLLLKKLHSLVDGSKEGVEDMEGEGRGGQPPLKPPFVPVSSRTSSGGGEW